MKVKGKVVSPWGTSEARCVTVEMETEWTCIAQNESTIGLTNVAYFFVVCFFSRHLTLNTTKLFELSTTEPGEEVVVL